MSLIDKRNKRAIFRLSSAVACTCFLLICYMFVDSESYISDLLLDQSGRLADFPFTIQTVMWLVFYFALLESLFLFLVDKRERYFLSIQILPKAPEKMISASTGKAIVQDLVGTEANISQVGKLVHKTLLQFLSTKSIDRSSEVLRDSYSVLSDKNELDLELIKYCSWLLPTLGFIGTVIGISLALVVVGNPPLSADAISMRGWMGELTADLAVAFNTTLLGLILSAVTVFFQSVVQAKRDETISLSLEYCLDNLINKLYED